MLALKIVEEISRSVALTDTDDIELEAPFQKLALDLICDAVKADVALGHDRILLVAHDVSGGHGAGSMN
jgi:hypothetical protein